MKISNKTYDILKWIITIVLPAVEVLWLGLGKVWGFPLVTEIGTTIALITAFLGSVFMISSTQYSKAIDDAEFDEEEYEVFDFDDEEEGEE